MNRAATPQPRREPQLDRCLRPYRYCQRTAFGEGGKDEPCVTLALRMLLLLGRIEIDNLSGLRSGNHIGEVGVLIPGHSGRGLPFADAFDPALFLVLLLLPTKLFSTTFFQLVASDKAEATGSRERPTPSGSNGLRALKNNGGGANPAPVSIDRVTSDRGRDFHRRRRHRPGCRRRRHRRSWTHEAWPR